MISCLRTTSTHDDFQGLVRLLDQDLNTRYGELQASYDEYNTIEMLDTVVLAYADDVVMGCGAFKPYDEQTVEIKRMFVKTESRGMGIAGCILAELERWAQEAGFSRTILETGQKQFEAIGLYRKYGYRQIDNYGQYAGVANSVCFEKIVVPR